jgi:hypothetical protein
MSRYFLRLQLRRIQCLRTFEGARFDRSDAARSFSPFIRHFMSNKGWIFIAGVLALALSLYLWFSGDKQAGIFVGLWVPSLWILADLVEKTETPDI